MRRQDRMLFLSGLATTVSLLLSVAGLTIAIIAAVQPPVMEYSSAAQNAANASRVAWLWPLPLMNLGIALWVLAQVVLRRRIPSRFGSETRVSNARIGMLSAAVMLLCAFGLFSVYSAFQAMEGTSPRHVTDSNAFSGLVICFGPMSLMIAMLGFTLFARWMEDAQRVVIDESLSPATLDA